MADILIGDFGGEHNVKGDSKREGHADKLEVLAMSLSSSGSYDAYHKRMSADVHTSFSFVTQDGTATPALFEASFKTHMFAKVTFLVLRREGSAVVTAYTIELKNVYIEACSVSYSSGSGASGDAVQVSLVYEEMKHVGKGNVEANWKHAAMTA